MFRRLLGNREADPGSGERVPRDQHLTDKLLVLLSGIRASWSRPRWARPLVGVTACPRDPPPGRRLRPPVSDMTSMAGHGARDSEAPGGLMEPSDEGRGPGPDGPIPPRWTSRATVAFRVLLVALLIGQLYVTGFVQRPDLLHPTTIGTDASNYDAAGSRLNAGHNLYGPLLPGDQAVPGYPKTFPAPLLSPPFIAVIWRPLAVLPDSMGIWLWWLLGLLLVVGLTAAFAVVGRPRHLAVLAAVLALGLPLTLIPGGIYRYPGFNSPVSFAALSGNVNTYLAGLLVLTWWAASRGHHRIAGTAAALAAVLKLGPATLLWWFVTRRAWGSARSFMLAAVGFGLLGLLFAGLSANLDFVHLALGGGVSPTGQSVPGMLKHILHLRTSVAQYGGIVATVVGLALVFALRARPRVGFAVAILASIYSSPVVYAGNFALLIAVAAPWLIPSRSTPPSIDPATAEPATSAGSGAPGGGSSGAD
jgi:hypothetical protein